MTLTYQFENQPKLCLELPAKLEDFLTIMDISYKQEIANIDMFDLAKTIFWNNKQKQLFAKLFYHARGHFYKFLWCIGSRSFTLITKNKVLENINEEFGEEKKSHEQLYFDFSHALGVSLEKEIYEEKFYLPFLREFDRNHIKWIVEHVSESSRFALFSAYERLDNIDYANLLKLVNSIGVSDPGAVLFFMIHSNACHFERLNIELNRIWESSCEEVESAFQFIYMNQLSMWAQMSNYINEAGS